MPTPTTDSLDRALHLARALDPAATICVGVHGAVYAEVFTGHALGRRPTRFARAAGTSASAAIERLVEVLQECVELRLVELRALARVETDVEERRAIEAEAHELEERAA
jgi:hypothetical protein